ncbi:hypothetical protein Patl1_06762 [Pistacia atlantica]|uniref:Uncharacterized protein n=1 Tax=Pistacia atlantica TaxID=434234 RepID=A0ACC1BX02_9ROSI|nr:hypothetical protein Patl1_06762 [Pistacia atlantica]
MEEQSLLAPRSGVKVIGEKRSGDELDEKHEVGRKRVKMRDLDSVLHSEDNGLMRKLVDSCIYATEINTHHAKSLITKEVSDQLQSDGEEMSQVTDVPITLDLDGSQVERTVRNASSVGADDTPRLLDLNSKVCIANSSCCVGSPKCAENSDKPSSLPLKHDREPDSNCVSSINTGLDLNAEDVASSVNQDPFYHYKNHNHLKARDVSECVSSTAPLEEKDPMSVWKEMKQNGFLSSSHGGISVQNSVLSSSHGGISVQNSVLSSSHGGVPPMPKQRGRKSKSDTFKKKMEIAKRENVDRFTKIAAPSGLLNELNPGIINNVRNRKQVYSIIEAIVRSEKHENSHSGSKQSNYIRSGSRDVSYFKDPENMNDSGIHRLFLHSQDDRPPSTFSMQTSGYAMPMHKSYSSVSEDKSGDGDSSMVDHEDDALALKLSSSTKASENTSSLSNEEPTNFASAASLSVKAATVASQWLELLHQDIKGRLSALRRSKKRVRAVITTELPFLVSKEFSSGVENDPNAIKNSVDRFSKNSTANLHQERWRLLFDQMDKALTEEEKQLETWLNQVKEMQVHCDQGLQFNHWTPGYGFQHLGISEHDFRSGKAVSSEKDLAVKAAAASIYSTCNFLASKENVSCC